MKYRPNKQRTWKPKTLRKQRGWRDKRNAHIQTVKEWGSGED